MTQTKSTPRAKGRRWNHELDVIGLNFRWKKENRAILATTVAKGSITGIRLVREPDNQYDPNAIAVYLPERLYEGKQLGYLGRESAAVLAPKLDAGTLVCESATLLNLWDNGSHPNAAGTLALRFRDVPAK